MDKNITDLLDSYKMPPRAIKLINNTQIIFLVGIAGAGKNTVLGELLKNPDYRFIVSHTTRPPRKNRGVPEKDGVNYHFIDYQQAEEMLAGHEFVEAKNVHGRLYGTSIKEIEKIQQENKIAVTDLDIQGVAEYKTVAPGVTTIFLLPPNFKTWQGRLMARYGEKEVDHDDMNRRMQTAKTELQEALDKEYFEFVINDDLARTVRAVDDITHGETSELKNEEAKKLAQSLLLSLQKSPAVQ